MGDMDGSNRSPAQQLAAAQAAPPAIDAAETSVRLGLTAGYDSYEENVRPQDTETGALVGLEAGVSALTPSAMNQ